MNVISKLKMHKYAQEISIKVLCEQTREANKRIKMFFGLCLILFGFGNIVADFHVLFRVRGN